MALACELFPAEPIAPAPLSTARSSKVRPTAGVVGVFLMYSIFAWAAIRSWKVVFVRDGGPNRTIHVKPGSKDRRVSHSPRNFESKTAGCCHSGNFAFTVDSVAIDSPVQVVEVK